MVNKGNHPQMAQQFRLLKYYNFPRYMCLSPSQNPQNPQNPRLHSGPSPDIASFGATVHALATSGRWRQALAVADHVVLNEVICGALVAACEKAARLGDVSCR